MIPFKYLPDLILLRIYEVAQSTSEDAALFLPDLQQMAGDLGAPTFITKAVHHLADQNLVVQRFYDPEGYELTVDGINYVERNLENPQSLLARFKAEGPGLFANASAGAQSTLESGTAPSYSAFKNALLIALSEKDDLYDLAKLATEIGVPFKPGWDWLAAEDFDKKGFIKPAFTTGGLDAEISGHGLEEAERLQGQNASSSISLKAPAADRIVQLNHNSEPYREAVAAVDQVIANVAGDNEYGDKFPEEKAALIETLRAGRSLLDATKVRVAAIYATLLPALKFVAEHWLKGTIATLAATAVAKLIGFF